MKKEKVFIEGYEVGFLSGTDGTREKKIQVASGEIVSIDEHFIYKSIEPEKVTIPKFVADYIEFQKKYNFHVYGAMRVIEDHYDKRVPEWFYEKNIETFARAWLDGYEVDKEKRYMIKLKGVPDGAKFLKYTKVTREWYFGMRRHYNDIEVIHTRKQLEAAGFGWVFDCPGIEVMEVEE